MGSSLSSDAGTIPSLDRSSAPLRGLFFTETIIPDSFLGGSAPSLRSLNIKCVPFPGTPNLILSVTHFVHLDFSDGPYSNHIPPEEMANCLSALTHLETLSLTFGSPYSPLRRPSPPVTRSILPDLTQFRLQGASEYLDDLVARIEAPRPNHLSITFPIDHMNFNETPHLVQFISRTPRFQEPDEAHVTLYLDADVQLKWSSDDSIELRVVVLYIGSGVDPQPSSIARVCHAFASLLTVENLRVELSAEEISEFHWRMDPIEDDHWLELLRPFTAVKNLYLFEESAPRIAGALQELLGSRITEVLPNLQKIFVEGLELSRTLQESFEQFVTARQLSGHATAISDWD